jgi:hypothetical protein
MGNSSGLRTILAKATVHNRGTVGAAARRVALLASYLRNSPSKVRTFPITAAEMPVKSAPKSFDLDSHEMMPTNFYPSAFGSLGQQVADICGTLYSVDKMPRENDLKRPDIAETSRQSIRRRINAEILLPF